MSFRSLFYKELNDLITQFSLIRRIVISFIIPLVAASRTKHFWIGCLQSRIEIMAKKDIWITTLITLPSTCNVGSPSMNPMT